MIQTSFRNNGSRYFEEEQGELMKYEPVALTYSGITMETLNLLGVNLKEMTTGMIESARRNTLSKGRQYKPILIGRNITFDIGFL